MCKGLRCVEIESIIERDEFTQPDISPEITFQRKITAGINILKTGAGFGCALRRDGKEPVTIQRKEVRAFPHIAERLGRLDGIDVFPVKQIL